jgi:hypothetical protein
MQWWKRGVKDEDVIKVNNNVTFIDEVAEDRVHERLKGGFPFVTLLETNVIITPADVKLCEVTSALEFVNEVGDQRQRCGILDRNVIQITIVLDGTEASSFLCDEEKRAGHGRLGRANIALGEVVIDIFFESKLL